MGVREASRVGSNEEIISKEEASSFSFSQTIFSKVFPLERGDLVEGIGGTSQALAVWFWQREEIGETTL